MPLRPLIHPALQLPDPKELRLPPKIEGSFEAVTLNETRVRIIHAILRDNPQFFQELAFSGDDATRQSKSVTRITQELVSMLPDGHDWGHNPSLIVRGALSLISFPDNREQGR